MVFVSCLLLGSLTWTLVTPLGKSAGHNWDESTTKSIASGLIHLNYGPTDVQVNGNINWIKIDKVEGNSNSSPPWTSSYASIYVSEIPTSTSYSTTCPSMMWIQGTVVVTLEEGAQTWTDGTASPKRTRTKMSNPSVGFQAGYIE